MADILTSIHILTYNLLSPYSDVIFTCSMAVVAAIFIVTYNAHPKQGE